MAFNEGRKTVNEGDGQREWRAIKVQGGCNQFQYALLKTETIYTGINTGTLINIFSDRAVSGDKYTLLLFICHSNKPS